MLLSLSLVNIRSGSSWFRISTKRFQPGYMVRIWSCVRWKSFAQCGRPPALNIICWNAVQYVSCFTSLPYGLSNNEFHTSTSPVIELQENKCGGRLYPSFPQQHWSWVVKISEGPGILWLPCNSNTGLESSFKSSFELLEFLLDETFCDNIYRLICSTILAGISTW